MSSPRFQCARHVVEGQHIRNYSRSTSTRQEDVLKLECKQYTPCYSNGPQPGDVTIIAAHANGCPKELYEPVWDDLLDYAERTGAFRIRNIWIMDVANQGASGVLNEHLLGNEPSWFDHARDYLALVNRFRHEMPRPIIGFGHSMGGTVIVNLALLHPRLLASVIAIEPTLNRTTTEMNFKAAYGPTFRKDRWSTREEANKYFKANAFYKRWDKRTFDLWLEHGLRSALDESSAITLKTSKHQEAVSFTKASYPSRSQPLHEFQPNSRRHPDMGVDRDPSNAFYRPEATITFAALPLLRPSCLYIYGSHSQMFSARPKGRAEKLDITGTGIGGSGGVARGAVADKVLKGSHFVPFETPDILAEETGPWMAAELARWTKEEAEEQAEWGAVPTEQRGRVDADWIYWMRQSYERDARKQKSKL